MKLKFFSLIPLLTVATSIILINNGVSTHTHTHTQTNLINTSKYDLSADVVPSFDEKWNASIKESSENSNIKLFFNRQATLPYQEAFLVAEYMILDNINSFSTTAPKDDEILFFYNYDLYNSIDYWNVKNWDSKYSAEPNSRLKFIGNTSRLGSGFGTNYSQFPTTDILSDLLRYYDSKGSDYKFDIWIVDCSLVDLWNNSIGSNEFYKFIQHVDKIYALSDGNWQTYYFIDNFKDRILSLGNQLTEQEIEQKFQEYRDDVNNLKKDDFDSHQLYDFVIDSNIFTFFHTRQYTDSPYYNIPNLTLYKTYGTNWNYYDFAIKNITDTTIQNTFIQDYEEYFRVSEYKTIADFFVKNIDSYDPTKKNVIWIGDSLILDDSYIYPQKETEMRNIFQSWLKLFHSNEYNILYKPHPSNWLERSVNYIKWISDSDDDSNIVYFSTFPWEVFLSWNYKMQKTNQDYVGLFSENAVESSNTVFLGFQFSSTTLQSTAFFLVDQYGYSLDQVESTLNPYYFPLPETFDIVKRTTSFSIAPEEQLQLNIENIDKIYKPFVENGTYPDYTKDLISANDFIKTIYNSQYEINFNNVNPSNDGLSQSAKIAIGVVVPVVAIAACVTTTLIVKKKKGKKLQTA